MNPLPRTKQVLLQILAPLLVVPVSLSSVGCLAATLAAGYVGGTLAARETVKFLGGRVAFEDVAVERVVGQDDTEGLIVVRGTLIYVPAKIRGQQFLALQSHWWDQEKVLLQFHLQDREGSRLLTVMAPGVITDDDVSPSAIPANQPVRFAVEQTIPRNLWERVATAKFENLYGLPGQLPPAMPTSG